MQSMLIPKSFATKEKNYLNIVERISAIVQSKIFPSNECEFFLIPKIAEIEKKDIKFRNLFDKEQIVIGLDKLLLTFLICNDANFPYLGAI